jgi:hypothetical protein
VGDIFMALSGTAVVRGQSLESIRAGGHDIGVAHVWKDRRTNLQGDKKSREYLCDSRHSLNQDRDLSKQLQEEPEKPIDSQTPK